MNLDDAKKEFERFLAHKEKDAEKTAALQKLAALRRQGKIDRRESQKRLAQINGPGLTVYDGSNLAKAIEVALKHL
ncbi:MAG: hypothetical protein GOVbin4685_67 [Prokaryotic dsDNA virus sp.]|jgi:hypothetical protein|nr:MAG: hypothetical protein GOVbin4685_67 [Prokaryotic dsDNA virus sp.]|tara:strand:+ start:3862 stop:4089 length:228 start_codon:yes stop_codon:yes gene_type:complete